MNGDRTGEDRSLAVPASLCARAGDDPLLGKLLFDLSQAMAAARDAGYAEWAQTLQNWANELCVTLQIKQATTKYCVSELWLG